MAYVFNDDKSRSPFIVIEGTVTVSGQTKSKTFTSEQLATYGIYDMSKYAVMSLEQTSSAGGSGTYYSKQTDIDNDAYPFYNINVNSGALVITVINMSGTQQNIGFRIVLIKVA